MILGSRGMKINLDKKLNQYFVCGVVRGDLIKLIKEIKSKIK